MKLIQRVIAPLLLVLVGLVFIEGGITTEYADARSMKGGRMFKMSPYKKAPTQSVKPAPKQKQGGNFSRGLAGGLLGGALGGLLFGSLFGMGGQGIGLLPILLLAGGAYFLFRRFARTQQRPGYQSYGQTPASGMSGPAFDTDVGVGGSQPPPPPSMSTVEQGLAQIQAGDRNFDQAHFTEVASDVFFQVQAGWMRRDLDSYRHLLGEEIAREYEEHFARMKAKGHINKLESIAVREVEIVEAGSDGKEDFVTILFTASLLDYTIDETSGDLVDGSMTTPVKFNERWTWARPAGTENWKLEGVAEG